jgi:hypothetical protein
VENGGDAAASVLSARQVRVCRRLKDLVSDGAAAFFGDACRLMADDRRWPTATHQVAHALREVESALRDVLEPDGVQGHREQILSVLQALEVPEDDPDAEFWLGLCGRDNMRGLVARAHRNGLRAPRPLDAEFRAFFGGMESMLDRLLERFEDRYIDVFGRLDELLKVATPKLKHSQALQKRFPANQVTLQYFFSRASAAWLRPLNEVGFFALPPSPQVNEDQSVSFPTWPASEYLVRVAEDDPQATLAAARSIPKSDNSLVTWNLVEIALALPPESGVQLAPQIASSIPGRYGVVAADDVGALFARLAQAGFVDAAMTVARAILNDLPTRSGPAARLRDHDYVTVLEESVPSLVAAAGRPAFTLLVDLLDKAIAADATPRGRKDGYDGSLIWRPAIERNDTYSRADPRNTLVDAIRAAASDLIDAGTMSVSEVVEDLASHRWLIFRRLTLDLLAGCGAGAHDVVGRYLTNPEIAQDEHVEREYLLLACSAQTWLERRDRNRLLALIDRGPDPSSWIAQHGRHRGEEPSTDLVHAWVDKWRRDRFAAVERLLPPHLQARYELLVLHHGQAPDPTIPPQPAYAVWSEESPVSADDLAAMLTQALAEFLRTWQPPTDWRQRDRSSLRGVLNQAVRQDAQRRSADARWFIGLDPVYLTPVLEGLGQAAMDKAQLDWPALVPLWLWVNKQAETELAQGTISRGQRAWRHPRLAVLRLLITGLNDHWDQLANQDAALWSIIRSASRDPDPTQDDEAADDDANAFELLMLDAVRPIAIRAAITYGFQARQHAPNADIGPVLALLDEHVDSTADPARAVHATYGSLFQFLVATDPRWAEQHLPAVFPPEPDQQAYWEAAWNAHLQRLNVTDRAWQLLRPQYARAVDALDPDMKADRTLTRAKYLGHHLAGRYWHGKLALDEPDRLLKRFYEAAPAEVTGQIIATAGQSLPIGALASPELLQRLTALWDYRVQAVKEGADPHELQDFDQWFISGAFDDTWALQQLLIVLRRLPDMDLGPEVLARIATLASTHTLRCLAILEQWLNNEPDRWALRHRRHHLRTIVEAGTTAAADAAAFAKKVASALALRGIHLTTANRK